MNTARILTRLAAFAAFCLLAVGSARAQSVEQRCYDMVQGKVSWDQRGSTRWNDANVRRLCEGAADPSARILCFQGKIASGLTWDKAIAQCQSTGRTAPRPAPPPPPPKEPKNDQPVRLFSETYSAPKSELPDLDWLVRGNHVGSGFVELRHDAPILLSFTVRWEEANTQGQFQKKKFKSGPTGVSWGKTLFLKNARNVRVVVKDAGAGNAVNTVGKIFGQKKVVDRKVYEQSFSRPPNNCISIGSNLKARACPGADDNIIRTATVFMDRNGPLIRDLSQHAARVVSRVGKVKGKSGAKVADLIELDEIRAIVQRHRVQHASLSGTRDALYRPGRDDGRTEAVALRNNGGIRSITFSASADASFVLGGNTSAGFGFSTTGGIRPIGFYGVAWTAGISAGADASGAIGVFFDDTDNLSGNAHGVVIGASKGIGAALTIWFAYEKTPTIIGFEVSPQGGVSAEVEYIRGHTCATRGDCPKIWD